MEIPAASKILRRSIYAFLQNYHYFTAVAALLAFPFSASFLLSQASSRSLLSETIHRRLDTLFGAVGFPSSLEFFSTLSFKLSETISSSVFTLPFTLTFLLIAKASVIQAFDSSYSHKSSPSVHPLPSVSSIYMPLLSTYLFNFVILLSANASAFALFFLAFGFFEGFGFSSPSLFLVLSAAAAVVYSIILANSLVICNLGLVLSGIERRGGYLATLKACVLLRGRAATALALALPVNLAMGGIEALFQYRVVQPYFAGKRTLASVAVEGQLIVYLYSILVVLDTVVSCVFYRSCRRASGVDEESYNHQDDEISGEGSYSCVTLKKPQAIP